MKILIAGDFCPQNRVSFLFEKEDFASVLSNVKYIIEQTDYSIVNFECPITNGGEKPIEKQGPHLQCSEKGVEAVKWAGFDCVTLANNHFLDYGKEGVENTFEACKKNALDTVGGGINLAEASKILYKNINGETLAIINCCEKEFSIASDKSAGANPLNPIQQYYKIQEAKNKADYVLVIVHGGHEMFQLPSPRMKETYRFFIDSGADAVVNHHQHCYSGYEMYKDKPIFYGLGNFLFDKKGKINSIWNEGYMVSLILQKNQRIKFVLYPYTQCNDIPSVNLMEKQKIFDYKKEIEKLNTIINDETQLKLKHEEWMIKGEMLFKSIFEPYNNSILKRLYCRHFLPTFISKNKKYRILNYIVCESHLDKLRFIIKKLK